MERPESIPIETDVGLSERPAVIIDRFALPNVVACATTITDLTRNPDNDRDFTDELKLRRHTLALELLDHRIGTCDQYRVFRLDLDRLLGPELAVALDPDCHPSRIRIRVHAAE